MHHSPPALEPLMAAESGTLLSPVPENEIRWARFLCPAVDLLGLKCMMHCLHVLNHRHT